MSKILQLIQSMCDISDIHQMNKLYQSDIYDAMQSILIHHEDKTKIKVYIREIYDSSISSNGTYMRKSEFIDKFYSNINYINIIQENVNAIKRVDKRIENDLEEHFQVWIPMSSNV